MKNEKLKKIQDIGTTIFLFVGYSLCISVLIVMLIFQCRQVIYTNYDNEPTTAQKSPLRANESVNADRLYTINSDKLNDAISNNHFISDNDYFEGVNATFNYCDYYYEGEITLYLNESSDNYNKSGTYKYMGTKYYMPANGDVWKLCDIYFYNDYYDMANWVYVVDDYSIICDEIGTSTIRLKNAVKWQNIITNDVEELYTYASISTFATHYTNLNDYDFSSSIGLIDNNYNFLGLILGTTYTSGYYLQPSSSPQLEWNSYYYLPSPVYYNDKLYNSLFIEWVVVSPSNQRYILLNGDILDIPSNMDIYYVSSVYLTFVQPLAEQDNSNLSNCYYSMELYQIRTGQYTYADNNNTNVGTIYYINNYQRMSNGLILCPSVYADSHSYFWNSLNISNVQTQVDSGSVIGSVFVLIRDAFSSLLPFLNISIVPGLTIGLLCFVPLILTIIIVVIRLLRK